MNKKLVAFLSILSLTLPMDISNSTNLSERDKKYAQVPYLAWNEIVNYKVASTNKVKVQVHAYSSNRKGKCTRRRTRRHKTVRKYRVFRRAKSKQKV